MAKRTENKRHPALLALSETIPALMQELKIPSYRQLAKNANAPDSHRTIGYLVKGQYSTGIDKIAATAGGLKIALWQLFVPSIAELNLSERKQLEEVVDAFVKSDHARGVLLGALGFINDAQKESPTTQSHHTDRRTPTR